VITVRDTRRTRILLAALLVASLSLIALYYLGATGPLRAAGGAVFGSAERALGGWAARFVGAGSASQVAALERQLAAERAALSRAQVDRAEYAQLSRLLRLAGQGGYRIVAATVIAVGQGYEQTVMLDAGSGQGIRPHETVLDGSGLIGTVISVTPSTCTVLLSTDTRAVTGVRVAGSGQLGWVTGDGTTAELRLHLLGPASALVPGDQLVTSGSVSDRPYVPGVPVRFVTRVLPGGGPLTATAVVRPFADFTALDVVGVVVGGGG
jgi:rod shape-determining protein MreC